MLGLERRRSHFVLNQLPWEPSTFKPDWPAQLFDAVCAVMHYLYHHEPSAALKKELSQAGSGLIDYCNQELIRRGGGYKSQKIKGAYFGNEIYNEELIEEVSHDDIPVHRRQTQPSSTHSTSIHRTMPEVISWKWQHFTSGCTRSYVALANMVYFYHLGYLFSAVQRR